MSKITSDGLTRSGIAGMATVGVKGLMWTGLLDCLSNGSELLS